MSFRSRFFVLCPSFHGATLFSKLINAHPEIVSLGDTYPSNVFSNATCGCGEKVAQCAFWQDIRRRLGERYSADTRSWLPLLPGGASPGSGTFLTNRLSGLQTPEAIARRTPAEDLERFRSDYERFLSAIAAQPSTDGHVFVDGVKSVPRVLSLMAAGSQVDGIIHITRNPVDFIASTLRRSGRGGIARVLRHGLSYRAQHSRIAALARWRPVLQISYEALSEQTDDVLRRVFDFMGVAPRRISELRPTLDQEWHFVGNASVRRFDGTIRTSRHVLPDWQRRLVRMAAGRV